MSTTRIALPIRLRSPENSAARQPPLLLQAQDAGPLPNFAIIHPMRSDRVLIDGPRPGADLMQDDTEHLRCCAAGETDGVVRVYWFAPPCLSLGRLEPLSDVDVDACRRDGIDIVRRPSGGRAVLHDDEVTYAVVCGIDDPRFGGDVMTSCARIHAAVAAGLWHLGIPTTPHVLEPAPRRAARLRAARPDCFAHPGAHELLDSAGRKLVGSAQARRGQALLQHGSVLLSPSRAASYLRTAVPDAQASGGQRAPSPGLRALAGRDLRREDVAQALVAGFREALDAVRA